MIKNTLISAAISMSIITSFYLLDRLPRDNGGNLIMFSFLMILCKYLLLVASVVLCGLFIFRHYYSQFWNIFITTFVVVSLVAELVTQSFSSFSNFLTSKYTLLDLMTFAIMVGLLLFRRLSVRP